MSGESEKLFEVNLFYNLENPQLFIPQPIWYQKIITLVTQKKGVNLARPLLLIIQFRPQCFDKWKPLTQTY